MIKGKNAVYMLLVKILFSFAKYTIFISYRRTVSTRYIVKGKICFQRISDSLSVFKVGAVESVGITKYQDTTTINLEKYV